VWPTSNPAHAIRFSPVNVDALGCIQVTLAFRAEQTQGENVKSWTPELMGLLSSKGELHETDQL
jgi:hypothetical protein